MGCLLSLAAMPAESGRSTMGTCCHCKQGQMRVAASLGVPGVTGSKEIVSLICVLHGK